LQKKVITSINGPVILAKGEGDFAMHDIVYIGKEKILGDVIKIKNDTATIQCYENTSGLKINEEVISDEEPLSVLLAPGLMGKIFDGIQRPLNRLKEEEGDFIKRGNNIPAIDFEELWHFVPTIQIGDIVKKSTIIGNVQETPLIVNRIMNSSNLEGKVIEIAKEGNYKVNDVLAKVQTEDMNIFEITMLQKWPVRKPREYKERLVVNEPLLTGQRVIDSMFPIGKGGTGMIPGGFGTGKTMLQHQFAKWSNADIIVYIGCGERGNEMTDVLEEFPKLIDPKTGRPMIERTILIANTSNMPVAAREASIYTGITMAEYYRDMGYNVAVMADSTSRWAEALREISGRLEELPAEEGFPSYLPSRLSEFYGRAGIVESYNGKIGSVTIIGAVSPQGSDFSEPVTQNTKRFVHSFWGLSRELAYSRHYPAVDWNISYSEYISTLQNWYEENVDVEFLEIRQKIVQILEEENELLEIARVVGQDVLSESNKLILEIAKIIRIGFLQQNALDLVDTSVSINKQFKMMQTIILLYEKSLNLTQKGIPISEIKKLGFLDKFNNLKFEIKNDELEKFDYINTKIKSSFKKLEEEYKEHI
jgi:V/A-type H+-transporting ATPase subunit A